MTLTFFPLLNASLNAASGLLLLAGYFFIRRRAIVPHVICVVSAVACSAAFLACYLYYHAHAGTTHVADTYPAVSQGLRRVYYAILFPHLTLAMVMLPMIVVTLTYAARRNWPKHLKIAPWTFGIWLYVSVTGVIIYWMLYHLFPGIQHVTR